MAVATLFDIRHPSSPSAETLKVALPGYRPLSRRYHQAAEVTVILRRSGTGFPVCSSADGKRYSRAIGRQRDAMASGAVVVPNKKSQGCRQPASEQTEGLRVSGRCARKRGRERGDSF